MYKLLARMIERKNYKSVEDMKEKLTVLYLNDQLSKAEYEELMNLLG
jgi:hypothetical protein